VVDLISEAVRLEEFLRGRGWRFCFIGGIAVQHWGEPRLTRDLDISLLTGFGGEEPYVDGLLAEYPPRMSGARAFALARRVLLLCTPGGAGIDVSLAALPFEEDAIGRAVRVELLPGMGLTLCSAEDLLVMKIFAGRDTDLRDARSVVVRQGVEGLDLDYVRRHLAELSVAAGDEAIVGRLEKVLAPREAR
jgi:hypothetical protein